MTVFLLASRGQQRFLQLLAKHSLRVLNLIVPVAPPPSTSRLDSGLDKP